MVVDYNGKVVGKVVTSRRGEGIKRLTVPVDKRYLWEGSHLDPRGTVTAIAFKDGYKPLVIYEVPVINGNPQSVGMEPLSEKERNEPVAKLGDNHRLEVNSLVDKYAPYHKQN